MQPKVEKLDILAREFNLSKEAIIEESLRVFLERKLREVKTEIFKIRGKYGISSVEKLEELYRKGKIEEKNSWQDLQKLDHLEFKRNKLKKFLKEEK
ncbi:MAG: hypothetical protein U9O41_10780 [Candidatus Aerophobetes bacterium]|nr:hypothetical protein [Candidatus Aerophobetes bacterium]